jgi:hypothetical protein
MSDTPLFHAIGNANEPHREKYLIAVFATNRFDGARIAGVTHSVADATAQHGDIVKTIEFEPRSFARDTLAKAMQVPRNAGALPRLVRVPSAEGVEDEHHAIDMREWRHGFTRNMLDTPGGSDKSPVDADGILVLLPTAPIVQRGAGTDPVQSGEAVAARYSLWLFLLLMEIQRVRAVRRTEPGRSASIPVVFAVTGADDRVGRGVQNAFARETDLFRMVLGDAGLFALSDDRRDALKIVKYFADRLSSATSAIVWSSPTDAVLAHTPAIAFRRYRRRRRIVRATATLAALGVIGLGYRWAGSRGSLPGAATSSATSARIAVAAALDPAREIPLPVRRSRLAEALELCKRPSANCRMEDVLRLGNELRRIRTRGE